MNAQIGRSQMQSVSMSALPYTAIHSASVSEAASSTQIPLVVKVCQALAGLVQFSSFAG